MASSNWFRGSHASPSPSNNLLATLIDDCLRICFTNSPERCIDFPTRLVPKDVICLRWAPDSSRVLIATSSVIEIIDLEDEQSRIRLDNGSSGLGRFSTADFLQPHLILTIWEFGRARIWNVINGQTNDIDDIKSTMDGQRWAIRPQAPRRQPTFAFITRTKAEDHLVVQLSGESAPSVAARLPTVDARALQWSPDGNWLVILDAPQQASNVHVLTADGHLYKSWPSAGANTESFRLGAKSVIWSPTSKALAVARHDGRIDLVSGQTLSQTASIEHVKTVDMNDSLSREKHAKIWQECVSASSVRSYKELVVPVSPPLSRNKAATHEPQSLGVAEVVFSCDGTYLASRDESMLSTVWIWDVIECRLHSVTTQHSNVRRLQWHLSIPTLLLIDCGENIVYLFDVASGQPPEHTVVKATGNATFSFADRESTAILANTKTSFSITNSSTSDIDRRSSGAALREVMDQEDSLFEILSGRAHGRNDPDFSHTERLEMDVAAHEETVQLDDTFDGRHARQSNDRDPLDDTDIF